MEGDKRGRDVTDDQIRQYIRKCNNKRKDGGVAVEHLRKHFGIGYKRAKRLHDEELGPIEVEEKDVISDEQVQEFIRKCIDEGREISVNELRHEMHIGYKRATKLLAKEQGKSSKKRASPRKRASSTNVQAVASPTKRTRTGTLQ